MDRLTWTMAFSAPESGLSPTTRFVLWTLSRWMDAEGSCWPSKSSIAACCGKSERVVQRALSEARACGWLEVEAGARTPVYRAAIPSRRGDVGVSPPNQIGETPTSPLDAHVSPGETPTSPTAGGGRRPRPGGGDVGVQGGETPTSPKPSKEPTREPAAAAAADSPPQGSPDPIPEGERLDAVAQVEAEKRRAIAAGKGEPVASWPAWRRAVRSQLTPEEVRDALARREVEQRLELGRQEARARTEAVREAAAASGALELERIRAGGAQAVLAAQEARRREKQARERRRGRAAVPRGP